MNKLRHYWSELSPDMRIQTGLVLTLPLIGICATVFLKAMALLK